MKPYEILENAAGKIEIGDSDVIIRIFGENGFGSHKSKSISSELAAILRAQADEYRNNIIISFKPNPAVSIAEKITGEKAD